MLAVAALCIVPVQGADGADFATVTGDTVIGVDDDAEYTIVYSNHDYDDYQDMNMSISYTASLVDSNGDTVSNGVSPSSGDLENGEAATLTVSAPDEAGTCTLVVEFTVEVTYTVTDDEGETETVEEEVTRTEEYRISVVEPVTLSVTLTNETDTPFTGYGVYFYVDGERMDDSYTVVNLDANGSTTVTYEWIAEASNGEHTFYILGASGATVGIEGLGESHTFYIGDNDYTWWIVLLVVVIVLLILVMVWVYRKPVKNYGKPKSRR